MHHISRALTYCILCCIFSRKVLVTIFNHVYSIHDILLKLPLQSAINQSTISDWSEDVKQNKAMKLSVLKTATCGPCLRSRMLRCTFIFYYFVIYKQQKQLFNSFKKLVKVSLVFIKINKLNTDQDLIQIKRWKSAKYW